MSRNQAPDRPEPQIVDAARRAVVKHGYAGLSLERIAAEAGVSRVTLHRRGFTTEEIFDELVERTMIEQRDALWPALAADGSGAERLRIGLGAICDRCEEDLDVMLAIGAQLDAVRHAESAAPPNPGRTLVDPIQVLLRDGVADGSLRPLDAEVSGVLLLGWVVSTYVQLRSSVGWKRKRSRETVVEHSLAAFTANGSGP